MPVCPRGFNISGVLSSSGGHTTSVCNQPSRPTQPPTLSGTENWYRSKCGGALRRMILYSRYAHYLGSVAVDMGSVYRRPWKRPVYTGIQDDTTPASTAREHWPSWRPEFTGSIYRRRWTEHPCWRAVSKRHCRATFPANTVRQHGCSVHAICVPGRCSRCSARVDGPGTRASFWTAVSTAVRIQFLVHPVYVVMLNLAITWFMSLG